MTKQVLAPSIIVKAIQANETDFGVSSQALVDLKNAGVDSSVMDAMLSTQASKPSAPVAALHGISARLTTQQRRTLRAEYAARREAA